MSMNPKPPAPAYGYGGKKTESRRIEGPGRSEYIITHRHGSEYQKQSVFASGQPQSLPSRYKSHGREQEAYFRAPPPRPQIQHGYDMSPAILSRSQHPAGDHDNLLLVRKKGTILPVSSSSSDDNPTGLDSDSKSVEAFRARRRSRHRLVTSQREERRNVYIPPQQSQLDRHFHMKQRSPRGLTFGISLARLNSDKDSSVSLTQTSETSLGHDGVKGSKNITEGDYKVYKESILSVSSSRYTNSLDLRIPVEAELVLQPPARPTEKSLDPLLTWM